MLKNCFQAFIFHKVSYFLWEWCILQCMKSFVHDCRNWASFMVYGWWPWPVSTNWVIFFSMTVVFGLENVYFWELGNWNICKNDFLNQDFKIYSTNLFSELLLFVSNSNCHYCTCTFWPFISNHQISKTSKQQKCDEWNFFSFRFVQHLLSSLPPSLQFNDLFSLISDNHAMCVCEM